MFLNSHFILLINKLFHSPILLLILTLILVCLIYQHHIILLIRQLRGLAKIPGPPQKFPFGCLYVFTRKNNHIPLYITWLSTVIGLSKIYYKNALYSIWLFTEPVVVLYGPNEVETLLTNSNEITKERGYDYLRPWLSEGLLLSTGTKWRSRRKLITPTFHFRILDQFIALINDHSNILIKKLKESKQAVDIMPLITRCALDIICETAMGVRINAQEEPDSDYVKAIHFLGQVMIIRALNPWYWYDFIFNRTQLGKEQARNVQILHDFTMNIIKTRKSEMIKNNVLNNISNEEVNLYGIKQRKAFLDYLLEENIKDENVIDEKGIQEEVDTFMFGGHDTTATSIIWAIYFLGLHQDVQDKVHEELDSIFGCDHDRQITSEDILKLKYLECCIKESMRLIPTVFMVGREPFNDIKIGEYNIPKGTTVNINFYSLHHNPEQFPEPEKYIPERFFPENSTKRHPFAFLPFSAGPRNCIGQKFAFQEMKIILSNILRNFKIQSLDPIDKIVFGIELVTRPKKPIRIQFIKR